MKNKYCPAGKIECECFEVKDGIPSCIEITLNSYLWHHIYSADVCPRPSKQKPIAHEDEPCGVCENCNPRPIIPLQNKKPFQKFEWKSEYDRGFAAAKAQAVDAVKDLKPIKSWTSDGEKFTDCWIPIHKDTQREAVNAISAIGVKHD